MRKYPAHPQADHALRTSAATNASMGILISVLSIGTFFIIRAGVMIGKCLIVRSSNSAVLAVDRRNSMQVIFIFNCAYFQALGWPAHWPRVICR